MSDSSKQDSELDALVRDLSTVNRLSKSYVRERLLEWATTLAEERSAISNRVANRLLGAQLPWPNDIFGGFDKWSELDEFLKTLGYRVDNVGAELMRRGWKVRQRQLEEAVSDMVAQDLKANGTYTKRF